MLRGPGSRRRHVPAGAKDQGVTREGVRLANQQQNWSRSSSNGIEKSAEGT